MGWKGFADTKKTRFTITVLITIFLCGITVYSLSKDHTDITSQCVNAIMIIVPMYLAADTLRASGSPSILGKDKPVV